jgi:hypothetical protein
VSFCVLPISKVNLQFSLLQMMLHGLSNVASVISVACIHVLGDLFFLFVFLIFLDLFCFRQRSKLVQNSSSVSGAECSRNTHTGVMLSQLGYLELDC